MSMSYNAEDLEKGKNGFGPKILHGLKRRSSVTLQAIARTFSVPGGKSVVRIPSQTQSQPTTLKEVAEEKEGSTTPSGEQKCFTNPLSDAELMASEVNVKEKSEGHPENSSVAVVLPPSKQDSSGVSSMC